MAISKGAKPSTNILQQSNEFVTTSTERDMLRKLQEEKEKKETKERENKAAVVKTDEKEIKASEKKLSKAKQIKQKRPLQVSIHYTAEEKNMLEMVKIKLKGKGYTKATVEDIVHEATMKWLKENYDNPKLLDYEE